MIRLCEQEDFYPGQIEYITECNVMAPGLKFLIQAVFRGRTSQNGDKRGL